MDTRQIQPDPCDNQIVRCHNMLQLLTCVVELIGCVGRDRDIQEVGMVLRKISDLVYCSVMSCMTAQVAHELKGEKAAGGAPRPQVMERGGPKAGPSSVQMVQAAPVQQVMQPAGQMITVQVPPGVPPGGQMVVVSPYNGQQVMVAVPHGLGPGATFQVAV